MTHRLYRRQLVPAAFGDVVSFFMHAENLEAITPPWLGFHIVRASDATVRPGTRIEYRLRLHGVPLTWVSRIDECVIGESSARFVDRQLRGPYRQWRHTHSFTATPDGVIVDDVVEYTLPLGPLGRVAHALFVRRQLREIFDFRALAIMRAFPVAEGQVHGTPVAPAGSQL